MSDSDFNKRCQESKRIMNKYLDRIPVIVNKSDNSNIQDIDKKKYLVPRDMYISQFSYIIRKNIKLNESEALFITINNNLVPTNITMSEIYKKDHNEDGFLYVVYSSENTFG